MNRNIRVLAGILSFVVLPLSIVWAIPTGTAADFRDEAFGLVQDSWKVTDLLLSATEKNDETSLQGYNAAADEFQRKSLELGTKVLSALENGDREPLEALSAVYRDLDPVGRQALYPALSPLMTANVQELRSPVSNRELREYFPGYGYTESGYKYRKGLEVEREFKGTTWQDEEQTINTTVSVELVINIDLLDILKGLAGSGAIKNLKVGKPFEMEHGGGAPLLCVKVSFQSVKTITTKTNRKFDVNKIWFELLRAKSGFWSNGPWEPCGKTYVIAHEPTGEHVVTQIGVLN